jgi:hypothetical protein
VLDWTNPVQFRVIFIAGLSTVAVVMSSVTVQQYWQLHGKRSGDKNTLCLVVVYLINDILFTSTQGRPLYLEIDW